jgi:hypothetical protein
MKSRSTETTIAMIQGQPMLLWTCSFTSSANQIPTAKGIGLSLGGSGPSHDERGARVRAMK